MVEIQGCFPEADRKIADIVKKRKFLVIISQNKGWE